MSRVDVFEAPGYDGAPYPEAVLCATGRPAGDLFIVVRKGSSYSLPGARLILRWDACLYRVFPEGGPDLIEAKFGFTRRGTLAAAQRRAAVERARS